jgi:hypothetical protein
VVLAAEPVVVLAAEPVVVLAAEPVVVLAAEPVAVPEVACLSPEPEDRRRRSIQHRSIRRP